MYRIALKMLIGDSSKYFGLIFGISFAIFLMSQQLSMFVGILNRTASQINDATIADLWVMDPAVNYMEEVKPLPDSDLGRVKSVEGVAWASSFYKSLATVLTEDSVVKVILLGVDDVTLAGGPSVMRAGKIGDLRHPNAIIMSKAGWESIFGKKPFVPFSSIEINDVRVVIVGLCDASLPFTSFPIVFARYSDALNLAPQGSETLTFILVKVSPGMNPSEVAKKIHKQTGLQALTREEFRWRNINYYIKHTAIPINFGITVLLGFLVGAAVTGQTFFIFVLENLRQFGTLKAIGVTNRQILLMVLLQAAVVGGIGFSLGIGLTSLFFKATSGFAALNGIGLLWEIIVITGLATLFIMIIACFSSIRRVVNLDPAIVFKG